MKDCVTGAAAAKFALPPSLAVREQVPTATIETIFPETVQTVGVMDVYVTVKPELAVAPRMSGATPRLRCSIRRT